MVKFVIVKRRIIGKESKISWIGNCYWVVKGIDLVIKMELKIVIFSWKSFWKMKWKIIKRVRNKV